MTGTMHEVVSVTRIGNHSTSHVIYLGPLDTLPSMSPIGDV